jgi:ABC-type multidrug transport system permease subunit
MEKVGLIKKKALAMKQQKSARKRRSMDDDVLMDAFNDIYYRRARVYRVNFVRGLFFGFGSVLGGTVLIAALIWILSMLFDIPGGIGDFVRFIVETIRK